MMASLRVIFMGTRLLGYEGLRILLDGSSVIGAFTFDHEITEGRTSADFRALCKAHAVPLTVTEDVAAHGETIRQSAPDLIVSLYWKRMVPPVVLNAARLGGINVHYSLLPRYRGHAPLNWAILAGDAHAGVTLHWMTAHADAGDVIDQRRFAIGPDETVGELGDRARAAGLDMLRLRLPQIAAGTAPRAPQDATDVLESFPRTASDGLISWDAPARRIHDLIRAVSHPYPGAFTSLQGRRLIVWRSRLTAPPFAHAAVPGTVLARAPDSCVWVATGDGAIELARVQLDGSTEVAAGELLRRGARLGGV